MPLMGAGVLLHGEGMTLKYRLEAGGREPQWWDRALFWACWAVQRPSGGSLSCSLPSLRPKANETYAGLTFQSWEGGDWTITIAGKKRRVGIGMAARGAPNDGPLSASLQILSARTRCR